MKRKVAVACFIFFVLSHSRANEIATSSVFGIHKTVVWLIILLVLMIGFLLYRLLSGEKQFLEKEKKLNEESESKSKKILKLQKEITDCYTYAGTIQPAILRSYSFNGLFPEHFIIYKPKKMVGGDFFYTTQKDNKIIVAVADGTGQGVPGAFMSMIGLQYLNEIIHVSSISTSDEILNRLKERLINDMGQITEETGARYNMDIALCIIDKEKMEMQFSGAYNSLYMISNGNLETIRGDRIAIGFSLKTENFFTRHNIKINENDILYLFTDGYCDQVGGENRKKFMVKRFGHLLLDIYQYPLSKQKKWIENTLQDWMGDNDQVDDITVLGMKI